MFADQYAGGAELTTQALLDACPLQLHKIQSKNVTMEILESGKDKFWVFGNFSGMDMNLIPSIVANLSYSCYQQEY